MSSSSITTSICRVAPMSCTHHAKIIDFSLTKYLMNELQALQCGLFSLGGYQWSIIFSNCGNPAHASLNLKLLTEAKVSVVLSLSLIGERGEASVTDTKRAAFTYYKQGDQNGFNYFMPRSKLECSSYVKDDSLTIQCDLCIIKPTLEKCIPVPPSNLQQHLGHMLQSSEGPDVSFKVKGEIFPANRGILAARSTVFRAELFGSMRESQSGCIEIEDMEPKVFNALLHFIYTNTFCASDEDEGILAQHLIVASNRYDLKRLRLICEDKLARRICKDNVVTT